MDESNQSWEQIYKVSDSTNNGKIVNMDAAELIGILHEIDIYFTHRITAIVSVSFTRA